MDHKICVAKNNLTRKTLNIQAAQQLAKEGDCKNCSHLKIGTIVFLIILIAVVVFLAKRFA